jgi:6-bladed beta-propeller
MGNSLDWWIAGGLRVETVGALGVSLLIGCAGEPGNDAAAWTASVDTLGDTITVRTTSGSVWQDTAVLTAEIRIGVLQGADEYMFGEVESIAVSAEGDIYVMDSQVPALRKYDSTGTYVTTFGRKGGGPGEYAQPDGGLAVLADGRVVLRDPANARLNIYAPDGQYLDAWRLPGGGGFSTNDPLYLDSQGNIYTTVLLEIGAAPWDWTYGLARFTPEGTHTDTLRVPTWDFERSVVTGERKGSRSSSSVPFTPNTSWSFSPFGYFVGGVSTDYHFDLYRRDGTRLRIERDWTPIPVQPAEADEQERRIRANFSSQFPGWKWNGPDIPSAKPAFQALMVGKDGTIWVRVPQPAYENMSEAEAREEERLSGGRPQVRFAEPVAFDVFEPDGRYLGHVSAPRRFSTSPTPVFTRDAVWATERGDLDVVSIVRFRVNHSIR